MDMIKLSERTIENLNSSQTRLNDAMRDRGSLSHLREAAMAEQGGNKRVKTA